MGRPVTAAQVVPGHRSLNVVNRGFTTKASESRVSLR
jgi:hypothetical protein